MRKPLRITQNSVSESGGEERETERDKRDRQKKNTPELDRQPGKGWERGILLIENVHWLRVVYIVWLKIKNEQLFNRKNKEPNCIMNSLVTLVFK